MPRVKLESVNGVRTRKQEQGMVRGTRSGNQARRQELSFRSLRAAAGLLVVQTKSGREGRNRKVYAKRCSISSLSTLLILLSQRAQLLFVGYQLQFS